MSKFQWLERAPKERFSRFISRVAEACHMDKHQTPQKMLKIRKMAWNTALIESERKMVIYLHVKAPIVSVLDYTTPGARDGLSKTVIEEVEAFAFDQNCSLQWMNVHDVATFRELTRKSYQLGRIHKPILVEADNLENMFDALQRVFHDQLSWPLSVFRDIHEHTETILVGSKMNTKRKNPKKVTLEWYRYPTQPRLRRALDSILEDAQQNLCKTVNILNVSDHLDSCLVLVATEEKSHEMIGISVIRPRAILIEPDAKQPDTGKLNSQWYIERLCAREFGKEMLQEIETEAKRFHITKICLTSVESAVQFYLNQGFHFSTVSKGPLEKSRSGGGLYEMEKNIPKIIVKQEEVIMDSMPQLEDEFGKVVVSDYSRKSSFKDSVMAFFSKLKPKKKPVQ